MQIAANPKPRLRVVAAVITANGKLFLAQRPHHKDQGGLWEFPGGKVNKDEKPQEALLRELREELGVTNAQVREFIAAQDFDYGPKIVCIEAYAVDCDPTLLKCLEHERLGWFSIKEVLHLALAPADKFLIPVLGEKLEPSSKNKR